MTSDLKIDYMKMERGGIDVGVKKSMNEETIHERRKGMSMGERDGGRRV